MSLLRCSRRASKLSKEAGIIRKGVGLAGRAAAYPFGLMGRAAIAHPGAALAATGGLSAMGYVASQDIGRGFKGMSPGYLAHRRAARALGMRAPSAPGQFEGLGTRVIRQVSGRQ